MAVFAEACHQKNLLIFTTPSSGADGHVSGTVDYDVFGEPVTETGVFAGSAGGSGGISALVFAYAGKPYDPVTGLSDYGFRDYASGLARFTTVDPIRDGSNWYAYCNSDPVNYVDAWGLTASDIAAGESKLQRAAKRADKLQDLVNTNNLAEIISSNINLFDPVTKAYYGGMPECVRTTAIREQLNKTTVYSGVDEDTEKQVLADFGATATAKDGLTIGNSIYILDELGAMDDVTADFLGHEGIHVISASAVGVVKFIEYNATASYDESNEYENTAYQFGGLADQNDFPSININNQVLDQYPGWWK